MTHETPILHLDSQPVHALQQTRFRDFQAFRDWVTAHWHDPQALRHAQWLISPFVAQAMRDRPQTDAWRQSPWVLDATEQARGAQALAACALRWLDAEAARALVAANADAAELPLFGLTELDASTAQALAAFGGALDLSGLRSLAPDVAVALAGHKGLIRLDGLEEKAINGTLIPLARRRAARGHAQPGLSLGGLSQITDYVMQFLAQVQGDLYLNGLTDLDAPQARRLAQRQGDPDKQLGMLHLDGWPHPHAAALQALAAYRGPLSLGAWAPPSEGAPELWSALRSAPRDGLSLPAIATLSEANAKELAQLKLKHLYLPKVAQLDTDLVEHLGCMVLQRLALDGVTDAPAVRIKRLVDLQNPSLSGLSMAVLVLTDAVRAELMRHKKLLDPLYERVYPDA
jgi:hypothetical protein